MSTLAEIEAAAEALPLEQKKKLLQFLESRVNGKRQEKGPADFARFAGTIRLPQDPLAWQQRACVANGAEGISDIEGKATRVGASERGQRTSFNSNDPAARALLRCRRSVRATPF